MPVFPVDKGIQRMCRRLRLVRAKAREEETGLAVERLLDGAPTPTPCPHYSLHVLMFAHAKAYCRPRNPKCRECKLMPLCPHGQLRSRHRPTPDIILSRPPGTSRLQPIILAARPSAGLVKHGDGEVD
jgi:endonuclease-3